MFCQLNYPGIAGAKDCHRSNLSHRRRSVLGRDGVNLTGRMGSLIKKRRKRMRKKKHRKLLKRTRVQRRNK